MGDSGIEGRKRVVSLAVITLFELLQVAHASQWLRDLGFQTQDRDLSGGEVARAKLAAARNDFVREVFVQVAEKKARPATVLQGAQQFKMMADFRSEFLCE